MRDNRRTRVVLALLLVTSLILIAVDLRGSSSSPLRGPIAAVMAPLQRAAQAVAAPFQSLGERFSSNEDDQATIAKLQAQVDALTTQARTSELARKRAAELDALLRVTSAGNYRTVPASVISVGPAQGFAWTVTIDAGSRDGIKPDLTVINGQGLVGRVLSVTASTATVVLVTDSTTALGARLEASMQIGVVSGTGQPTLLSLRTLDPLADLKVGQRLVSFGVAGGVYVTGVPIGVVTAVGGTPGQVPREVTVRPFIDVTSLDLVGVVVEPPRTDPRDAVLPPTTASVAASPAASASIEPSSAGSVSPSSGG